MLWYKHLGPMQDMVEQKDQAAIFSLKTLKDMKNQKQHVGKEVFMKSTFFAIQNFDPCLFLFW